MNKPISKRTKEQSTTMRIGVDFDNTIVCYDAVFRAAARERRLGSLEGNGDKEQLRTALRASGREDEWTELQGFAYGPGMKQARPFRGVGDFFSQCRQRGVAACIISHRTQFPYRGEKHDLHAYAREWLATSNVFPPESPPVFFELTKEAKLERIAREGCTHFIDDLPELLCEPCFPAGVARILFDPHDRHRPTDGLQRATSWDELSRMLFSSPGAA